MNLKNTTFRAGGLLLFAAGVLLGILFIGLTVWGDLEASMFDTSLRGDASLRTLRCPVMITTAESGTVAVTLANPTEKPVDFRVRTHISQGYVTLMRESNARVPLAPGEEETLEWTVTADDAAYGHVILVRVLLFGHYPLPSRRGACGVLVLDLPYLSGRQITILVVAASLAGMLSGVGLWFAGHRPPIKRYRDATRAISLLAASVLLGLTVSLLGWWLAGALVLAIIILLIGTIVGHFWTRPANR